MKYEVREKYGKFYAGYIGTDKYACYKDTREECEQWIAENEPKPSKQCFNLPLEMLTPCGVGEITSNWDKVLKI